MKNAPIGVFDSGVGGLTVLRALLEGMPAERFIYLGDTARLPYGTKSASTVVRYALQAAKTLHDEGVKCLVVACNTAASVGLEAIRERFDDLPVIGVVEPGAEAACAASSTGHIAVIATDRTVHEGAYQQAIRRRLPQARLSVRATPLFVALAEEGLTEGPIAESVAQHYLGDLFNASDPSMPDTLVLGCTHFPILKGAIRRVTGAATRIVDSASTIASAVRGGISGALAGSDDARPRDVRFLATDGIERFARVGSRFLNRTVQPSEIELVELKASITS
jgi:glutamate racemase